ncbi:hypothetical protein BY458DRAFT_337791 [Sporodiniella umbellata]|nr:hypothetical protein BY458DRAFT_337791 [Sporodiniella umbellata]
MVFMIDLSSSLATIETGAGKVMMGNAYQVLENTILGLIQPFSIDTSDTLPPIMVEHSISITVIAECSQFGSNMNVIPILAEYPTMRVLLQNIQVTSNNSASVLKTLHTSINKFKMDLGNFRKKLTVKRSKLGYELDVRRDHSQTVDDTSSNYNIPAMDSGKQQSKLDARETTIQKRPEINKKYESARHHRLPSSSGSPFPLTPSPLTTSGSAVFTSHSPGPNKRPSTKDHNHRKDVWGVGKTGSNLSYILRAGLFALNLLPKQGKRSLVLITDGVVKSNISDETIVQQMTVEDISCSMIQVGQADGFFPGLNFGFIPDNEILKFVASVTHGHFMYADECTPVQTSVVSTQPNCYHQKLLFHEIYLDKASTPRLTSRKKEDIVEVEEEDTQRVFPWDPFSTPINEDTGLLKYKEYFLPTECWHFIRARLRQGFALNSVSLFDESNKSPSKPPSNSRKSDGFQKERVIIVFVLRWQPQMTVEYRIKSLWTSSLRRYLKSISQQDSLVHIPEDPNTECGDSLFSCMRAPKAEILVRATTSFSHMLHNWESFQRRSQMMAVQGAKSSTDLSSTPGFIKVGKMKRLLERLAESDTMLKQLVQFNQNEKSLETELNANTAKFSSLWSKLDRSDLRTFNMCWYDEKTVSLIINCADSLYDSMQFYLDDALDYDETELFLCQIYSRLEEWASYMSDDKQTCIKTLTSEGSCMLSSVEKSLSRQGVPQFCEVRVVRETDRLICVRFLFFNTESRIQQTTVDDVLSMLNCSQISKEKTPTEAVFVNAATKRPLSSLLLRDNAHFALKNHDVEPKNSKLWFINPAHLLTGEFIVRNILQQNTWHWDVQDVHNHLEYHNKSFASLIDLAFEYISFNRSENKWNVLSFNKSFGHFYKEIPVSADIAFSVQYFVWKDYSKKSITTELWAEPFSNENTFKLQDTVQSEILEKDKSIFNHLVTFDILYAFGSHILSSMNDLSKDRLEMDDDFKEVTKWMQQSSLFSVSSVISQSSVLLAAYSCPNYNRHYHPSETDDLSAAVVLAAASSQSQIQSISLLEQENAKSSRRNNLHPRSRTVSRFSPLGSPLINVMSPLVWPADKSNACVCPRPDELFCNEKDAISKLRPVLRDVALLHYYVEHSLSSVADRNFSLSRGGSDDYWGNLVRDLIENNELGIAQSTLFVSQNFRDLRCFIKTFDPSTFVLIFIPRLDAVVKGLGHFESKAGRYTFDKISLTMFECHRQILGNSGSWNSTNRIKVKPVDSSTSQEWIESLGSTLRPSLLRGNLQHLPEKALSDRTLLLMQKFTQVYSRSFVKSVFTCLLHGRAIDNEDFEKVLEICDESNLDIDLTGYLNVQTLLNKRSRTNEEELLSINQRFVSVLGHYFEPVIISNSEWTNIYCYRPPFAKVGQKLGLSLSSGEKPTNLADVVICAQNPLFVRLECTFCRPTSNGFSEITFPLDALPSLYTGQLDDGASYNFEPAAIGTDSSPIASADGTTATLHMVCMTLPQSNCDLPNALFSHLPQCPADNTPHHQASFLDVDKTHRARLPSLSQDKQDALVETEARLTWLFTEEIMHGLLRSGPVTQSVIRYIEAQLKKKNPFVDFPTTMFIPLAFVKNRKDSRRLFLKELEKHNNTPYRLIRVGDCFYASDNGQIQLDTADSMFDGLNITADEESNDEYCQGLGISILEPYMEDEVKQEPIHPQLYWLLLIPQAQSVQIYFYSKMQQSVNRSEIIRVTKYMVNEVMERTNQLTLLQHLHDTRVCSKYLLEPMEGEKQFYSSDEETSDEDDYVTNDSLVEILSTSGEESHFSPPRKFFAGQFKCDIVFTRRFPLHWRLQPNAALNKLMTDTLLPFLVKNKPGMFVISHNDSVVYCFLSETNTMMPDSNLEPFSFAAADDGAYHPDSPYGSSFINSEPNIFGTSQRARHPSHVYSKTSPQGSVTSERQSPKNSPSLTDIGTSASSPAVGKKFSRHPEGRELILEVYGVEADSYIIEGLVEMIESRITSEITLKEVQQFLIRNPTTKLSRADVEFILPIEKEALLQRQIYIPLEVKNIVQFLKLLRKNILASPSLHAIYSNYLGGTMRRHHGFKYGSYPNDTKSEAEEWSCLNLLFYYNYLNRAPGTYLPFEQRVGEGVAGVCLTIIKDGQALSKIPDMARKRRCLTLASLKDCFIFDFERKRDSFDGYEIRIDIWSHSKLEVTHIYDMIYKAFRQSICDYLIETAVSCTPPARKVKLDEEFKAVVASAICILEQASLWESPSVKKYSRSVSLTPWYFDGLVSQFKGDLQDIHPSFDPVIARARVSSNLYDTFGDETNETDELNYKVYNPFEFYERVLENSMLLEEDEESEDRSTSTKSRRGSRRCRDRRISSNEGRKKEAPMPDHKNYKYLVISGLPDLYNKYSLPSSRRFSMETTDMSQRSRPMNSIDDELLMFTRKDLLRKEDSISIHSRQESLASSTSKPLTYIKYKTSEFKDAHLHSFVVMTMDTSELTVYSYNYSETFADHIFNLIYKNVVQQETRHMGLSNILHQKIGLFYHTDKMSKILSQNNTTTPQLQPTSNAPNHIGASIQHSTLSQIQSGSNTTIRSPSLSNKIVRLAHIDSESSIHSSEPFDPRQCNPTVNFESLKQLMKSTFEFNIRFKYQALSDSGSAGIFDRVDNARLCKTITSKSTNGSTADVLYSAARTANANTVLRDTYARSTELNKILYSRDYLVRHGEPYLHVYLSRSKPLEAHEKAFKVYSKWAERYYGPGHTKTIDEMMTVSELQEILKASRLLHFCRTPIIFSEASFSSLFAKTEEMTTWYEKLARGFMKEYASYLESIGMHLIVYGPSNDQQDEKECYLSQLMINEAYSVDSPVVYLLQVFEGGSIMCEARLTRCFVSVTLYTLHRRYGRLQFSPYSHQSREVGRENFQRFMSECDQFKQRIHVNSFVFDFHLRHLQRSLDDADSLPPNLNLLDMIRKIASVYDRPAIYSRNRIIKGVYGIPIENALTGLVPWILNFGSKLGLKALTTNHEPVACFVSSDDLSFDINPPVNNLEDTPFRYTLIICPENNEECLDDKSWKDISTHQQGSFDMNGPNMTEVVAGHSSSNGFELTVQYFILVTYRGMDRCTNSEKCQRAWSEVLKVKPKKYKSILDEPLEPEATTLKDILDAAKIKLGQIVNKATYFYHRENDWNKLYQATSQDKVKLTMRFSPIDLCDANAMFSKLLGLRSVDWNGLMDYLQLFYLASREMHTKDTRQLLLFFRENTFFNLLYKNGEPLCISINTKEDRKVYGIPSDEEQIAISQLATIISCYIWKSIK